MAKEIELRAGKIKRRKKIKKIAKLLLLIFLLFLFIVYIAVSIIYNGGNFTISLDKNLYFDRGIIIYDNPNYKVFRAELYAETLDTFDNTSYKWFPNDLDNHTGGTHNGDNYLAYTFFVENTGKEVAAYWSEIIIDDVIKHVDEAMRLRVYKNGVYTTYAKISKRGTPEIDSVPFTSDTLIVRDHVKRFRPGDIDKYTIVLWLEGSDPECTENILGGEIKIHMDFKSEIVDD